MMAFLKRLWHGWKAIALRIAQVQAAILLFLLYFTLFTLFGLFFRLFRKDPLLIRRPVGPTYWRPRPTTAITLERAERLF